VKIAASLTADGYVDDQLASEVLRFAGVTADGLTKDMQAMLTFLYQRCERRTQDGEKKYQASVSTIATAIGKSRDQKAVALRVEPYLIEQGYVQVGHGGRTLTDAGIVRALRLIRSEG
jgi:Holliday junction resolvasome RuvABC ATP-dependent DNA helicase subunit